jgi:DNA-binding transcriptional regulator YhcF (GntR family)
MSGMNVAIDPESAVPPFEQVRAQFAHRIADGTLPVGTKLPTVRALAADLSLATNTVARAYRELETAGMIETRGRAGTFVAASGDASRTRAAAAAADYVTTVDSLGVSRDEALAIVTAALRG